MKKIIILVFGLICCSNIFAKGGSISIVNSVHKLGNAYTRWMNIKDIYASTPANISYDEALHACTPILEKYCQIHVALRDEIASIGSITIDMEDNMKILSISKGPAPFHLKKISENCVSIEKD